MGGTAWVMAGVGGVGRALDRDAVTTLYRFIVMLDELFFLFAGGSVSSASGLSSLAIWPFDISQIQVLVHTSLSQKALCLTFSEAEATSVGVKLGSFPRSRVMLLTTKRRPMEVSV